MEDVRVKRPRGCRRRRRCCAISVVVGCVLALGAAPCSSFAFPSGWRGERPAPPWSGRDARGLCERQGVAPQVARADVSSEDVEDVSDLVLPIGPACPFKSVEMEASEKAIVDVFLQARHLDPEFQKLAQAIQTNSDPDVEEARRVGTALSDLAADFGRCLDEAELSQDFQAMEIFHMREATDKRASQPGTRVSQKLMAWQGACLLALAEDRPPPPLPEGIPQAAPEGPSPGAAAKGQDSGSEPGGAGGGGITGKRSDCLPFDPAAFDSAAAEGRDAERCAELKGSFESLVQDHKQLVELGRTYGNFDGVGKEFYLNQMSLIAFRWEDLIEGALAAGVPLTEKYRELSRNYLRRLRLPASEVKGILEEVHDILRTLAAKEAAAR